MNFLAIANKKNSIHNGLSFNEALNALGKMLGIIELVDVEQHRLEAGYEAAFGIDARIIIRRDVDPASFGEEREFYRMHIEVAFSSSHFTPVEARARAILINHVADMACFAEACVSDLRWDREGAPLKFDRKKMKWS
jgi:hypothetical protein